MAELIRWRGQGSYIRCPICLNRLRWDTAPAVRVGQDGQSQPLPRHADVLLGQEEELDAYRECAGGGSAHLLPYHYGDYGPPVVIGIIAGGLAGKTHLLAAMIGTLIREAGLGRLQLRLDPLDFRIHAQYEQAIIRPFLQERRVLPVTRAGAVEFTDALRVYNPATGRSHAIAFFDVGGEQLQNYRENVFLSAVNALLFVVDAAELTARRRDRAGPADPVFDSVLDRLGRVHGYSKNGFVPLPAAVVVAKADLLRFLGEPDLDHWFGQQEDEEFDLSTVERESEDVFRLLHRKGKSYLTPATKCLRSTLHFASAAGVAPDGDRFPELGFGPRRTLKPLLSLFGSMGILGSAAPASAKERRQP
jgi:hypothetical protein